MASFEHTVDPASGLAVHVVPVLNDNYAYLLVCQDTQTAAVVDPVEPEKLLAAAAAVGATITTILTTHSHFDHAGGNAKMAGLVKGLEIYGGRGDDAEAVTHEVGDGDVISVGKLRIAVLETPCHTKGHVCYYVNDTAVFTGDTLFVAGCGNFNAGSPQQMHDAFAKLNALPGDTLVYVGHEYTMSNFAYARFVEPANEVLKAKHKWTATTLEAGGYSIPSTIAEERLTNPFMRTVTAEPDVLAHCGTDDPVAALKYVRVEKSGGRW
eukprot:CAMPEP_0182928322 /NCGR_PEP_ID=MMETSP0105_2-20130417/15529_1 /TAXON_ID=81532 ORGANISM="Acanthoeca-like sp., Strain 10tr" /NCGR_SAMPLE_ID=MMETSP0105_2 /ASSEMBLY_ACC=CAM_ASM_000205 /LENGTH=266 /DNA_ID=CAMNT_0025066323 /DNA_START=118 /DNA_END=915 /DNA_ORIENTATION=-